MRRIRPAPPSDGISQYTERPPPECNSERLAMTISFACKKCGKQYKVGDSLGGKAARCKACSQMMKIPDVPRMAAAAVPAAASEEDSSDNFGLEGPLQSQDDFFGGESPAAVGNDPCPLGNHALTDPRYSAMENAPAQAVEEEEIRPAHNYSQNQALSAYNSRQELAARQNQVAKRKVRKGPPFDTIAIGAMAIALVASVVVGLTAPAVGLTLALVSCGLAGLVALGAYLWGLVLAAKDSWIQALLYVVVPLYMFIYMAMHFAVMKRPFLLYLAAVVCVLLSFGCSVWIGSMEPEF